jgi:site-specific DNA-methyltransferase (adenine-specific)
LQYSRKAKYFYDAEAIVEKRSVWEITTQPIPEAHFAVFPEKIPSLCILAGCPEGGIVYDPFMGAATTALAALKYGRQFIGSEINPEYCEMGEKRIKPYMDQLNLAI